MAFEDILGQGPAVETLRRALASDRVHHAYRFEGPDGVGKELTAFALAAELVSRGQEPDTAARSRRRCTTLSDEDPRVPRHPDVVLVQRGLYGKTLSSAEAAGISVEQVRRVVLTRVGFPPHEGQALVFIVRDAEELTVQAANALLKTLEEPGPRTHFILLTSRPQRLLDTVLSRTLAIRFGPLPDAVVAQILARNGLDTELAPLAQGSASAALELADPDLLAAQERFVNDMRVALTAPDLTRGLELAELHAAERATLRRRLVYLAHVLAQDSRAAAHKDGVRSLKNAHRHAGVLRAIDELERNVQPALVLETLVMRLRAS